MALVPNIYFDPALTDQFDDATDFLAASAVNGGDGDGVFYIGTPTATNKVEAETNPGVDPITVSITDSTPGVDVEATDIKLASSQANLDTAVAGNPLTAAVTILGGQAGAVPVWYRWTNQEGGGVYTDITLDVVNRVESAQ